MLPSTLLKKVEKEIQCPQCKKKIEFGIELEFIQKLKNISFPHIHLHGKPLHALLCYINSDLEVKNIGVINSIEISRDSETFTQFLEKWMNPY